MTPLITQQRHARLTPRSLSETDQAQEDGMARWQDGKIKVWRLARDCGDEFPEFAEER